MVTEKRRERAKLVHQARQILDAAEAESRNLTAEENQKYDQIMSKVTDLKEQIDREEKLKAVEKEMDNPEPTQAQVVDPETRKPTKDYKFNTPEYRGAFSEWLRGGHAEMSDEALAAIKKEYKAALQADLNISGGYLVAPMQMVQELLKGVDDMVFIRQRATKFQIPTAMSLGVPSLDADPDDADWTSELKTGTEDTGMSFGGRELHPHPLAKRIKISNKLLRAAAMDTEALARMRLEYKFGITEEKAFLVGTGANQPLGVFTASDHGISTSRDVSDGNDSTSIKFDGLINAKYTLKSQYWERAAWMFHRDALKQIAKLKDGEGQYIWRESVREGEPDRILNMPFEMSEYVPNTFTTGQYVGVLGDFSFYWIADALDMQVQRLVELYAESNQTGLIGRLETDGMPVLEEAFVRVKLG